MSVLQNPFKLLIMYIQCVKIVYIISLKIIYFMIYVQSLKQKQLLLDLIQENVDSMDPILSLKVL